MSDSAHSTAERLRTAQMLLGISDRVAALVLGLGLERNNPMKSYMIARYSYIAIV